MRNELINILCVHILISNILMEGGGGGGCITVLSTVVFQNLEQIVEQIQKFLTVFIKRPDFKF